MFVTPEGERQVEVGEDEYLLDAALAAGLDLPSTCLQGWCITCAARLEEGRVDQSEAQRYFEEDREAGFILPCTARPRSELRVVTHQTGALRRERLRNGLPTPRG